MSEQRTLFQILIEDWARRRRASGAPLPEIISSQFGGMIVRRDENGNVRSVYVSFEHLPERATGESVVPPIQNPDLESVDC